MGRRYALMAIVVLVLMGCQPETEERVPVDWKVGNQGAFLRFLPDLPRPRMYDDSQLNVVVEVNNLGASPLGPNDRVYLHGFDPAYITGISTFGQPLEESEGKSQYNPQGTTQYVTFEGQPVKLGPRGIDRLPMVLQAVACYNYQTIATENVCIDLDPFSPTTRSRVCRPQPISPGTQAAPIAVSHVDVEPAPGRTRFTITVKNVGTGNPFIPSAEYMQKCSPYHPTGFRFGELDMVRVNDVQVSGRSILPSCKPLEQGNLVRLINGQARLFCDFRGARTNPAYFTPLIVDLEYGYRSAISTPVELIASN